MNNRISNLNTLKSIEINSRLRRKVKADVIYTKIDENDNLIVYISGFRRINFRYIMKNIHLERLSYSNDLDYDKIVRLIIIEYHNYINNLFFELGGGFYEN